MGAFEKQATSESVLQFLWLVDPIKIWIDGGWGVDALLGEQRRIHSDLDIIIGATDFEWLVCVLTSEGYSQNKAEGAVYESPEGLSVDIHCVRFDKRGYGSFDLADGRVWPLPPSAFEGKGMIGDRSVNCLSPEAQVQCHAQGYEPTTKDIEDMAALQEKFQVVLPLRLCRSG